MFVNILSLVEYKAIISSRTFQSRWVEITQSMINSFADATLDHQFIHTDPESSSKSGFGGTIAHGYLTLSLLSTLAYEVLPVIDGTKLTLNYGMDRLRFITPVRTGKRIRGNFTIEEMAEASSRSFRSSINVSVQIEDEPKPALVGQWTVVMKM
ncbi:MaoC family dehydratase [Sphingosinicella soli]|uniref:Acyl dehydratase n=1 Tax=Sphingosinicella soli TaxID=333708 RepID=A0A7W7F7U5_9SPHN|nr:MaoC family dehydratase [Sphingosinicella soli]MBB4633831.1 acyl dehydratase [Sphingosinicella soli]